MPQVILKQGASRAEFDALATAKGLAMDSENHALLELPTATGGTVVCDLFYVGDQIVGSVFETLPAPAIPGFKEWGFDQVWDFFLKT